MSAQIRNPDATTRMNEVVIFDGIRTPFGRHGGALAQLRPDDMLAACIGAVVESTRVDAAVIEDVIAGDTNQAGEDSRNVARNAALLAGLPVEVAGLTVNRLCGSGIAAVLDAFHALRSGNGQLMIAGGVESMSRSPWVLSKAESSFARDQKIYDSTIGWRFPNPRFIERYGGDSMPETADNIAKELLIGREDSDRFALRSQQRYETSRAAGFFSEELLPVQIAASRPKEPPITVSADEHPRPEVTFEKLASMKPLQAGGVVTAGNASGINDGAGALLIGTAEVGKKLGLKPRARILSGAVAGVEPRLMGLGPVPASQKALRRAGLDLAKLDVIEINEAFATQVLGCLKQMQIPFDEARVNPNGGAIAVGHPLGASGIRLVLTAMRQLERARGRYALATMCIGLGQGIAIVLERCA
jgi:acetyl-CoA C-acetyltransferase